MRKNTKERKKKNISVYISEYIRRIYQPSVWCYTKKSLWRLSLEKRKKVEKLLTFDSSLSAGAPTHWMSAGIFTSRRKRDQASVTSLADVYCRRAGVTSVAKNWRRGGSPLFTPASGCVTAGWRSGKRREREKKLVSVWERGRKREMVWLVFE